MAMINEPQGLFHWLVYTLVGCDQRKAHFCQNHWYLLHVRHSMGLDPRLLARQTAKIFVSYLFDEMDDILYSGKG